MLLKRRCWHLLFFLPRDKEFLYKAVHIVALENKTGADMRGSFVRHGDSQRQKRKMIARAEKEEQRKRQAERLSYLETISDTISIPQEIMSGATMLSIHGRNSLLLENYKKILEYSDTVIRVQTRQYYINIFGNDLRIQYYTKEEMKINGVFLKIEFS